MVDTINPNTNQPDSWDNTPPAEPTAITPEVDAAAKDRFFGGFNKPDDVKINLADGASSEPINTEPAPVHTPQQPLQDVAPAQPSEIKHTSYVNKAEMINWRGIMVIALVGIIVAGLVGAGVYFAAKTYYDSKIASQEADLSSLSDQLLVLEETPDPLTLPVTTEDTTTTDGTTTDDAVVVTPVETPSIETEDTQPIIDDTDSAEAAG